MGGKRLSEWVDEYGALVEHPVGNMVVESHPHVNEAINHIGTNAVPFLVRWAGYGRPAWKKRLIAGLRSAHRLPQRFVAALQNSELRAANALLALCSLASKNDHGMPWLSDILSDPDTPFITRWQAVVTLQRQGPAGLPPLLACLTNQHSDTTIKVMVVEVLGTTAAQEPGSLSTVESLLNDPDSTVRQSATNAIEMMNRRRQQSATP